MTERVGDNLAPQESASVQAKGFKCPNCGGPVNLELPGKSQTIRCPHCSSVLEPGHDVLQLREKYNEKFSHKMWIPLSAEGTLEGVKFKCVGMVVRGDDDEGEWCEYLLFNPYHGYRYLVESSGHWTLVQQIAGIGFDTNGRAGFYGPTGKIKVSEKKLRYFTHYKATVKNIIGEFPWQAAIGEINAVTEYINPPYAASCETVSQYFDKDGKLVNPQDFKKKQKPKPKSKKDEAEDDEDDEDDSDEKDELEEILEQHKIKKRLTESNWSVGEYKYPEEIAAAFNLTEMPERVGFGMCEPNPVRPRYLFSLIWTALLFVATTLTCSIVSGRADEKVVMKSSGFMNIADFELKREKSTDFLEFNFEPGRIKLDKDTNAEFDFKSVLNQQWVSLNVFLINEATGEGYIYDTELSQYSGGSGDDSWSEGSDSAVFKIRKIPAGTYYVYVAGATNFGLNEFRRFLRSYGTRDAIPVATIPSAPPVGAAAKSGLKAIGKPPGPTPKSSAVPAPVVAGEKRGKLLPVDFPGKETAPHLNILVNVKSDLVSGSSAVLFIFMLIGFNIYYYIRYRMKEGER